MINTATPEMLWESSDADIELQRRFGFVSVAQAAGWVKRLLAEDYDPELVSLDRLVISAQNLMLWVTVDPGDRLMIKVCRMARAHDWLTARGALVGWLAEQELPVARPLPNRDGDHQLLRDGWSIGVQPVLRGELLDAADLDQVRAAGEALGELHGRLATWPDADLLTDVQPVAGGRTLWVYPDGHLERVPTELQQRLERRIADLPELPRQPIHADFRAANVLYRDGRISGILDFEEARIDAAVVDLAHAVCLLGTWYRNWQPITPEAQRLFLDSYADRRPLTDAEATWLPPLVAWGMLGQGWWEAAASWLA